MTNDTSQGQSGEEDAVEEEVIAAFDYRQGRLGCSYYRASENTLYLFEDLLQRSFADALENGLTIAGVSLM